MHRGVGVRVSGELKCLVFRRISGFGGFGLGGEADVLHRRSRVWGTAVAFGKGGRQVPVRHRSRQALGFAPNDRVGAGACLVPHLRRSHGSLHGEAGQAGQARLAVGPPGLASMAILPCLFFLNSPQASRFLPRLAPRRGGQVGEGHSSGSGVGQKCAGFPCSIPLATRCEGFTL